jgi:hypothetical protein
MLHTGIYEGKQPGIRVFTLISGMQPPQERLNELEKLATWVVSYRYVEATSESYVHVDGRHEGDRAS